ncbi:molybdopterin synthase sulfur carrier subunit [Gillisia sp. Hel1_33_143]|uniref:MoaD/ThiS family protein n=1 Tax=Gillisia sp. Hel1_33_143 TaxID=1336796 RepID=UPI00087CE2A7|nr:MoaD/ThiS family protein [Gillisia sp. Hel1_33_143]SDS70649.1 molybdopterin synthase sulfur carrier subunit [Gillisia sp. Hel1_33_143]
MKVTIKYFGMIAETAGKSEEILDLKSGFSVQDLKDLQVQKYKIADPEAVQIAVNQDLNSNLDLKEGDEVAFLPPFAGG